MALGFIRKVFTFGKEKPASEKPPEGEDFASLIEAAEKTETEATPEETVIAAEPVLPEVIETAGGPSPDEPEALEAPPALPGIPPTGGGTGIASTSTSPTPAAPAEALSGNQNDIPSMSIGQNAAPAVPPPVGGMPGRSGGDNGRTQQEAAAAFHPQPEQPADVPHGEIAPQEDGAPKQEGPVALPRGFATVETTPEPEAEAPKEKLTWFQRLKAGLFRTSSQLTGQIAALFTKRKLDEDTLDELEDLLIQADLGVETAMRITGALSSERYGKDVSGEDVARIMAAEITKVLKPVAKPLALDLSHKPHVVLVVGVNGTGKTTTIGKLAAKLSGSGLKVMLAAGDTFRAAAIEQLKIWADRTGSTFIGTKLGADAAGLAYDAFERAKAEKSDVLIIDTAGRLQNKAELMAELEKIVRVLGKLDPEAPHTVLQTLDATTGQNAMNQVEIFRNVAGVNGLIMTKLDGTARGGILVAIAAKHRLPVYFIGVGEGVDDLEPFEAEDFASAIAGIAR